MHLKPFFKEAGNLMSKTNAITSVPLSFLLVGLEALINLKFSCPCKVVWNQLLSSSVFIVPALFAFVIMLMLLRHGKYKHSHAKKADSGRGSKEQDNSEASQEQGKSGQSQEEQNESGKIQSQAKQSWLVCLIPPLVWICIFFIDGDYLACAATDWNGRHACDKELHPVCLNWCKPTEFKQGRNETGCYERTRELIRISKITGYTIAFVFCFLAVIFVVYKDCSSSACCKSADPKSGDGKENSSPLITAPKNQREKFEMDKCKDDDSTQDIQL